MPLETSVPAQANNVDCGCPQVGLGGPSSSRALAQSFLPTDPAAVINRLEETPARGIRTLRHRG